MADVATLTRSHADRRQGERRAGSGALLREVGRLRSAVANVATVDRERADRIERRLDVLDAELERILEALELEPLPTQE